MFIGQYTSVVNEKGRCALPAKFRQNKQKSIVIAKWYEGCLIVVDNQKFSELLNKITGKSEVLTRSVRDTDRFILGSAYEVDVDSQGRVVLPKHLRVYAKITGEAVFLGLGDRIEIWDKDKWEEKEKDVIKTAESSLENIAQRQEKV